MVTEAPDLLATMAFRRNVPESEERDIFTRNMEFLMESCTRVEDALQDLSTDVKRIRDGLRQMKRDYDA